MMGKPSPLEFEALAILRPPVREQRITNNECWCSLTVSFAFSPGLQLAGGVTQVNDSNLGNP